MKICQTGEEYTRIYSNGTTSNQFLDVMCHKNNFRMTNDDTLIDSYFIHDDYLKKVCNSLGYSLEDCWDNHYLTILTYLSILVLISLELSEMCSIMLYHKQAHNHSYCYGFFKYAFKLTNFIDNCVIVMSIGFMATCRYSAELSLHAAGWMVFFAWISITLHLGRFNPFSKFIYMSIDVSSTMMLCLLTFLPCFLAFTFAFHSLLHSNSDFSNWSTSFFGLMEKMLGELNYADTFDYVKVNEYGGRNISAQVMYLLFLIFMSIVVMNLLITIALSKTENLVTRSKLMSAHERIEDIAFLFFTNEKICSIFDKM